MKLGKTRLRFFVSLAFLIPTGASADFLEEFSMTRAFARETLRIMRSAAPPTENKISVAQIDQLIQDKSARYGINPDFIRAVVRVESGYSVSALSPKGAIRGLGLRGQ